ncbi:MAG TPA: site-2 protease family protein [Polyangiaceae bacterium]|nr:site-2 protease family protein [Polyangiaceae bacterium]
MKQPPEREPGYDPPPLPPAFATASGAPASGASSLLRGGAIALVLGLLAKGKSLLVLLKAAPFGKVLLSGGTMIASVLAYALQGGFPFAIGLVLLILIHELGHGYAMKRAGVAAGWPIFIPFFGAMIAMKGHPEHPRVEANIAFGGPLWGTGAALVCAGIGLALHSPFFLGLAYVGFFLNLFNLAPFGFLDGGRIARVLSRKAWIIGAILMGLLCVVSFSPQILLIAALGAMHIFQRDNADLEQVTPHDRVTWAVRYFGLIAFLALALVFTYQLTTKHGW